MKKKQQKKSTKDEQKLRQEQEREQQRLEQERKEREMREKEEYLENRSSPLISYGLIDAFEYFMVQLTQAGIPQGNLYEFAAQTVLKYQKNLKKKTKNIDQVNKFNEIVIKSSPTKQQPQQAPAQKPKPPQVSPLKKQLTQQQKQILNNLNRPSS